MKTTCFLLGIGVGYLVTKIPWYRLFWDEPQTPPDWEPRMRRWINGEELT